MVSFCCDNCNETLKKAKVKQHNSYCRGPFTCLDCNVTMGPGQYEAHTSCISEAQRYEKTVWKGDKVKGKGKNKQNGQQQQQQQQAPPPAAAAPSESKPAPTPAAEAPATTSQGPAPQETSTAGESSTATKKAKKEKKRKRSEPDGGAPPTSVSGEFLSSDVLPSAAEKAGQSGGALQETDKQAVDVHPTKGHANGIDQAEKVRKADEAHMEKKRRKGKKGGDEAEDEGEDAKTAEAKALGKPVPQPKKKQTKAEVKERMLNTYSMSVENGAEVTLKYLLEQAEAAGADRESIIGDLKVTSVKKGKFVVSFD